MRLGRREPAALKMVLQLRWADSEGTAKLAGVRPPLPRQRIIARNPLSWRKPRNYERACVNLRQSVCAFAQYLVIPAGSFVNRTHLPRSLYRNFAIGIVDWRL